jgi:hypothetical protein
MSRSKQGRRKLLEAQLPTRCRFVAGIQDLGDIFALHLGRDRAQVVPGAELFEIKLFRRHGAPQPKKIGIRRVALD